jgi:hypothetical protein
MSKLPPTRSIGGSGSNSGRPSQQAPRALAPSSGLRGPSSSLTKVGGGGGDLGVPLDSDYVHDEIKELAKQANTVMKKLGRPTDEAGLLAQLQLTGPSKESKAMLMKEEEAARASALSGVYCVYRNEKKTSECFRIGPSHVCFCRHTLTQHQQPKKSRRGNYLESPGCSICRCSAFVYVPNQPEEIGEGWLSRRANFNLAEWAPKCRCGHGSTSHSGEDKSKRCAQRGCSCPGFQSHFACVVCDGFWEDHETVFETDSERRACGRAVGEQYRPLSDPNVDPQFREIVFEDRPTALQMGGSSQSLTAGGKGRGALSLPPPASAALPPAKKELPPWCESCAAVIKDPSAKFCNKCGARR